MPSGSSQLPENAEEMMRNKIEVWKVALKTQMHFNDLLIKTRTTVASIILAIFGASAIALKDEVQFRVEIFDFRCHISVIILVIGLCFLIAQFILDYFYYFRLLLGAVKFTTDLDEDYPELFGLTTSITKSISPCKVRVLLIIYYLIPFLLGGFAIWVIQCKLLAQ